MFFLAFLFHPDWSTFLAGFVVGGIVCGVIACCITMYMDEYRMSRDDK